MQLSRRRNGILYGYRKTIPHVLHVGSNVGAKGLFLFQDIPLKFQFGMGVGVYVLKGHSYLRLCSRQLLQLLTEVRSCFPKVRPN